MPTKFSAILACALEYPVQELHECKEMIKSVREISPVLNFCGGAITVLAKSENVWVIGNSEYGTVVYFCPFCGQKLGE